MTHFENMTAEHDPVDTEYPLTFSAIATLTSCIILSAWLNFFIN